MADHVFVVCASPPEGVSDQEFFDWYDRHIDELLAAVPGFVSGQRFRTRLVRNSGGAPDYKHFALYEVNGDLDVALTDLRSAVDSGNLSFPDWFPTIELTSWGCEPLTDKVEAGA